MPEDAWTPERMLEAIAYQQPVHLPVGRKDPEWEHNARVLDDLFTEGWVRADGKPLKDGAGAYHGYHGLRVTSAGRQHLETFQRDSSQSTDLDAGERTLLRTLVDAVRASGSRGGFMFTQGFGSDLVSHPTFGDLEVDSTALRDLTERGFIRSVDAAEFEVRKAALEAHDRLEQLGVSGLLAVEHETVGRLTSEALRKSEFSAAVGKWEQASGLLLGNDSDANLTAVGHHLREAHQLFALAVARAAGADGELDGTKTVDLVRAALQRQVRSDAVRASLLAVWGTAGDLAQRLEHGGQKEGEAVTWNDARGATFATAFAMSEISRVM